MLIDVVSSVQDQRFVTNYIHWVCLVEPILLLLESANNDLQFAEIAAGNAADDFTRNALLHPGTCVVTECVTEKIVFVSLREVMRAF
jgi:hypothetical protein